MGPIKKYTTQKNPSVWPHPSLLSSCHILLLFSLTPTCPCVIYQMSDFVMKYIKIFFMHGFLWIAAKRGGKGQKLHFYLMCALTFTHIYTSINKPYCQNGGIITLEAGNINLRRTNKTASQMSFYWCSL